MEKETTIILDTFMPAVELVISSHGKFHFVPFTEIIRIRKKGDEVFVITATETYPCSQSMEEIMRDLPAHQFARVQKSHIISLAHFDLLKRTIPITKYFRKELNRKLGAMLEQEFRTIIFRQKA